MPPHVAKLIEQASARAGHDPILSDLIARFAYSIVQAYGFSGLFALQDVLSLIESDVIPLDQV